MSSSKAVEVEGTRMALMSFARAIDGATEADVAELAASTAHGIEHAWYRVYGASAEPWPPLSAEDVAYLTDTWRRPMSPVGDLTFEQTRRRILAVLTHAQQAQEKGR